MRADGLYLLPGAIDSHVHFRDPGYPNKETWKTGSAAAALRRRDHRLRDAQHQPADRHRGRAAHQAEGGRIVVLSTSASTACSATTRIDRLEDLLEGGVTSFKAFVGNTFGNLPAPTDGALLEGFEILAPLGIRTVVHAENSSIMARRQKRLQSAGRIDSLAHLAARPAVCRDRGDQPRADPGRVDRRARAHRPPQRGRFALRAARRSSAAASTSRSRPARSTCCSTPTTCSSSAASCA